MHVYIVLRKSAFENEIILVSRNFFKNFSSQMGEEWNLRIKTKNYVSDPVIGFFAKRILKPFRLTCPIR